MELGALSCTTLQDLGKVIPYTYKWSSLAPCYLKTRLDLTREPTAICIYYHEVITIGSRLKFEAVIIMAHASGAVINIALDKHLVNRIL